MKTSFTSIVAATPASPLFVDHEKRRRRRRSYVIFTVFLIATIARADVVTLKDGRRLEGDVKKSEGVYVITAANGIVTRVDASKVDSITLGKSAPTSAKTPSIGADRLASLRRSVESLG